MSPEELQKALNDYLRSIDRTGDLERIAQRLAYEHTRGSHVVGFRRRGREVLLHQADRNELTAHEIGRSGQLLQVGTIWKRRELRQWIEHHHHYLEWVNPEYKPKRIVVTAKSRR